MTQDGNQPASGAPDHGRTLEFGFFLDPAAKAPAAVVDTAGLLDRLGYDLIGIQDHPYQAAHLDTQSLLGVILAQTSRVIPIWIGANKPRALALTGRIGDGWVSPLMMYKPPAEAAEANRAIDRAAIEAGRQPRDIRRIYNIQGSFTRQPTRAFDTDGDITGPPEQWSDVLTHFALDVGFDTFILGGDSDERTITTFITDVAPAVRQRVADARALSPRDALTDQRQLT